MSDELSEQAKAAIAGYAYSAIVPEDTVLSDVDIQDAYSRWLRTTNRKPTAESWEAFEAGWFAIIQAPVVRRLTVAEAAWKAGVTVRYIRDEIEAGRLPATKSGRQYEILEPDFEKWMANPNRGSHKKK